MNTRLIYIFSFSLLMLTACSHANEDKCSKLKHGEFYYKGSTPMTGNRIQRHDSMQLVTDEGTGNRISERIIWSEPCSYTLYPYPDTRPDILGSGLFPIKVNVLDISEKYYTVHISTADHKNDVDDTAWIVK